MADGRPGRRPLSEQTAAEARRLHRKGHTLRTISQTLGISRGAAHAIVSGQRDRRREQSAAMRPARGRKREPGKIGLGQTLLEKPVRAPCCGAPVIIVPCPECGLRKYLAALRAAGGKLEPLKDDELPADLNLKPAQFRRYLATRAARQARLLRRESS